MTNQTEQNRALVTAAMQALAGGDSRPFVEAWSEDFVWRPMVGGVWGKTFHGKQSCREELFRPLMAQYANRYTNTPDRIFADRDTVIVECRGAVTLTSGKPYNNTYCFVITMEDGKMAEVREYLDSALAEATLEPLPG
jgi:ketosteroid isomerase-like protein